MIILICNWVVANHEGSYATLKRDEYGFILINFECLIMLYAQSFVFPMHVEQVFFAKYVRSHINWKVVSHQEPKWRRL
jgi:hypothetical protein